jgi:hypothetical protein
MEQWIQEALAPMKIGDKRNTKRLGKLISQFSRKPTSSIPEACGKRSETKAAYRFFSSPHIAVGDIQKGVFQATQARISKESKVIVAQDTTNLDFTTHAAGKGFGYLERAWCRGIKVHSALAISTEGIPLGLLNQQEWVRKEEEYGKKRERKRKATKEKESQRWLDCVTAVEERVGAKTEAIIVGDREADIFDLFAQRRRNGVELVIRCAHNRAVAGTPKLLFDKVLAAPRAGTKQIQITRARNRKARMAQVEVRFVAVEILPPRYRTREHLSAVPLWAISVKELAAPRGVNSIEWLILTTIEMTSLEQAWQCIQWYTLRWLIERYHYVLKSGCQVEELQLEEAERITRALAVYSIVAWRLLFLTYSARIHPEQSCAAMLEQHEWEALSCFLQKTKHPPSDSPTMRQAVQMLAQLGGFLGRKSDGHPGVKVVWRGVKRLDDIAQAYLIFKRYG